MRGWWGHEAGVGWLSRRLETWLLTRPSPQRGQHSGAGALTFPGQFRNAMCHIVSPALIGVTANIRSPGSFQIFTIYVITPERHYGFPRIFAIARVILQQKIQRPKSFTFSLIIPSKKIFLSLIMSVYAGWEQQAEQVGLSVWSDIDDVIDRVFVTHTHSGPGMTEWLLTVYLSWRRWHRSWDRRPKPRQRPLGSKCCVLEWSGD